jgi:hypothetical protein
MDILEKLFGSLAKVKIMKLFIFNGDKCFDKADVSNRTKVAKDAVRSELVNLEKARLIKQKSFFKEYKTKSGEAKKKRMEGWVLDETFPYLQPLQKLLLHTAPITSTEIVTRLSRAGKMKLIITAGVFIQNGDSRADLLVVGDRLNFSQVDKVIKNMEAEIGRELKYAVFETPDYKYRLSVYDKLIRDILDFPHEKLLDKLNVVV